MIRPTLVLLLVIATCPPALAQALCPVEVHYAPNENLERRDVDLLRSAWRSIDFAAFTFSDFAIIDELMAAGKRGVSVRLVLDPSQLGQRRGAALERIADLAGAPNVRVRVKVGRDLMHLKSYVIDGAVLRSGSANFTASGLKRQNNDMIVLRCEQPVRRFNDEFNRLFETGRVL